MVHLAIYLNSIIDKFDFFAIFFAWESSKETMKKAAHSRKFGMYGLKISLRNDRDKPSRFESLLGNNLLQKTVSLF